MRLQTQLACITQEVVVRLELVDGIRTRGLESQFHLQLVVEEHTLLIVVVQFEHRGGNSRIVGLTTLVPVVRHIVLQELHGAVEFEFPEVWLLHHNSHRGNLLGHFWHGCNFLSQFHMGLHLFIDVVTQKTGIHEIGLVVLHQIGTAHVQTQQSCINGICHVVTSLRNEREGFLGTRMIKCGGSKKPIVASVT